MSARRSTALVAVAAAVATFVAGAALVPRPPQLSAESSGDSRLVAQVRDYVEARPELRDRLSIAVIDGDSVRTAQFGATLDTEYEVGSVTKTVTGSLLAIAIERGEVTADTPLGDLLELGTSPAASITLQQLATQSSGLPRLPSTAGVLISTIVSTFRASDPYGSTLDELLADARAAELGPKEFLYSNFGFALLGQALATAAGTDYAGLAEERVFGPLGMDATYAPDSVDDLSAEAPTGYTASGRPTDAWTLAADSPAGSVRSTTADLVAYVQAQLDGTAPGVAATGPVAQAGDAGRIGYAWITGDGVTWHNGSTGGFTSWVGFDRETGRGVVVLNDTAVPVDDMGFALMGVE